MSKLFKRLGTKVIKYQVDIKIISVELRTSFPCDLQVSFRRGNHKIETNTKATLDRTKNKAIFNETIGLKATLYFDTKKGKYQEKTGSFTIVIVTPTGNKKAGIAKIDLADYANSEQKEKQQSLSLQNCPDQQAKLNINMKLTHLGEIDDASQISETASYMSERLEDAHEYFEGVQNTTRQRDIALTQVQEENKQEILRSRALQKAQQVFDSKNSERKQIESIFEEKEDFTNQQNPEEENEEEQEEIRVPQPKLQPRVYEQQQSQKIKSSYLRSSFRESALEIPDEQHLEKEIAVAKRLENLNQILEQKQPQQIQQQQQQQQQQQSDVVHIQPVNDLRKQLFSDSIKENINKSNTLITTKPNIISKSMQQQVLEQQQVTNEENSGNYMKPTFKKIKGVTSSSTQNSAEKYINNSNMGQDQVQMENEIIFLREKLTERNKELKDILEQQSKLSEENDELKSKIELYSKGNSSIKIQDSSSREIQLRNDIVQLRTKLNEKNDEITQLINQNNTMQTLIDNEKKNKNNSTWELQKQVKELQSENDKLNKKHSELNSLIDKLQNDNKESALHKNLLDNNLKNLQKDYNRLQTENTNYKSIVDNFKNQQNDLQANYQLNNIEKQQTLNKISVFEKELNELRYIKSQYENDKIELESQNDQLKTEINKLKAELNQQKSKYQDEIQSKIYQQTQIENVKDQQLSDLRLNLKDAESFKEKALSEQTKLQVELQDKGLQKLKNELEYKKKSYEDEINELREIIQTLEKDIEGMKHQQQQQSSNKSNTKQNEQSIYKEKYEQLRQEKREMTNKLDELEERNLSLEKLISQLEISLQKKENSVRQDITQTTQQYQNQISELHSENEILQKKLKEQEKYIEQLKKEQAAIIGISNTNSNNNSSGVAITQRKIKELEIELQNTKQELNEYKIKNNKINSNSDSNDMENAKISIENENLKRQLKDAQNKLANQKTTSDTQNQQTAIELKKQIQLLQSQFNSKDEELNSIKLAYNTLEISTKNNYKNSHNQDSVIKTLENDKNLLEEQLWKTKKLIGDMMNLAYEEGGELAEKITNLMMNNKQTS